MCFQELNRLIARFAGARAAGPRSRVSVRKRREAGYTDRPDIEDREQSEFLLGTARGRMQGLAH
jgi:hypothetical protein